MGAPVAEQARSRGVGGKLLWVPLLLAVVSFGVGLNWGLPSRSSDVYLFPPAGSPELNSTNAFLRSGVGIDHLAGGWDDDPDRGADVAQHPLRRGSDPIPLNDTNAQRARLLRRYRLYSAQPDEMITFRALAQMKPGELQLDPRLYQYGGLWVYPVGALLKLGGLTHLLTVTSDRAFYLDHPEEFGRFYIVARAYSAAWGLVGVWCAYAILRRVTDGRLLPACGAAAFAVMPVVVNMAHEAKPHLPGAVLFLLAVLAACRFIDTGKARWVFWSGLLAGAAAGMVLSMTLSLLLLPIMALVRRDRWGKRVAVVACGVLIAATAYFATNPYVAYHLLRDPAALRSNLGNSSSMYRAGDVLAGASNTAALVVGGTSAPLAVAGLVGIPILIVAAWKARGTTAGTADRPTSDTVRSARGVAWLLAVPAAVVAVQCASIGAGKPGEFGRFALVTDIALAVAAFATVGKLFGHARSRAAAAVVLLVSTLGFSVAYYHAFVEDTSTNNSRTRAAAVLASILEAHQNHGVLGVRAEPAPYCCPPVDVFRWKLVLLPADPSDSTADAADVEVRPLEVPDRLWPTETPLSWAGKPFEIIAEPPAPPRVIR